MVGHSGYAMVQRLHNLLAKGDAAEQSDVDLLRRFTGQVDAGAFAAIVHRHGPMVLGVCRRLLRDSADADDAFQATFAVLIRKAASLSRPEDLAGWLFQVAYRTARRARAIRSRRQSREMPLQDVPVEAPISEVIWREIQAVFDEEVNRLPDKLRLPVVLCFMEGRTKRAAAQALGWPEGTLSCRLQQARELLRARLSRRGVTVSAGALTLGLVQGMASAAVPAALASSTIQSASLIAAGSAMAGPVAALTQGVIQSMFMSKLKIVVALVLTVGVLGGGTGWVLQSGGSNGDGECAAQSGEQQSTGTEAKRPNSADRDQAAREAVIAQGELVQEQLVREVAESESNLAKWQAELERAKDLLGKHVLDHATVDEVIGKTKVAAAELKWAQAALELERAEAALNQARKQALKNPAPAVPAVDSEKARSEQTIRVRFGLEEAAYYLKEAEKLQKLKQAALDKAQAEVKEAQDVAERWRAKQIQLRKQATEDSAPAAKRKEPALDKSPPNHDELEKSSSPRELGKESPTDAPKKIEATAKDKLFTIEFNDARWDEVIRWFSKISGLPFVSAEKPPTGTFTIKPIRGPDGKVKRFTIKQIIDILNDAMFTKGYLLVRREGYFTIVPADERLELKDVRMVKAEDLKDCAAREFVQVICGPLKSGSEAEDIAPEIKGLMGKYSLVKPLPQSNRLLLVGQAADVQGVIDLLNECPSDEGDSQHLVRNLKNVKARLAEETLIKILGDPKKQRTEQPPQIEPRHSGPIPPPAAPTVRTYAIAVDDRRNKIYICGPAEIIANATKILDELDKGRPIDFGNTPFLKSYATPPGQAETLVKQLSEIPAFKPCRTFRIWAVGDNEIQVWATPSDQVEFAKQLTVPKADPDTAVTKVVRLTSLDAAKVAAQLKLKFADPTKGGPFISEDDRNGIVVRGTANQVKEVENLIHTLDPPAKDDDAKLAKTQVAAAEDALANSEIKIDRLRRRVAHGDLAKEVLNEAMVEKNVAAAKLKVAQAALDLELAKASLEQLRKQATKESEPTAKRREEAQAALSRQQAILSQAEAESQLERTLKLKASGAASDAEVDRARITVAEARLVCELHNIVELRQKEVDRCKQLWKVMPESDLKKAVDALDAAKRRLAELK